MGKIEEIINGISAEVLISPVKEIEEPPPGHRLFEFEAPFLGEGQRLWIMVQERQSGTLDLELDWIIGQVTSDCYLELLKMNYRGIYGPFYASVIVSKDPPGVLLCIKHAFTVPASTSPKEAVDVFWGNIQGFIMLKKNWPEGVEVWEKKS